MPTLNWIGKEAVVKHHLQVPFQLLKDVPDLACGDPGTGNIIMQADNLVGLKALLPYYAGKVKCVCIDPPYNTGNEGWVYNDNVNSPLIREWLGKVVGKEGETLDRHDRWLCMMYPRLLQADRAVILWLVPSNTILDQTADALRDPGHPYRRALETACAGPVEVVTIEEALRLSRAMVESQTVVIVATIQAFRVEDTTGRKVYDQNGSFAEHLQNLPPDRLADLLPGADGKPRPSLVNVLRLRRPIVVVDEAHNARTLRSFVALADVRPSCVIELTATPSMGGTEVISGKKEVMPPSNILHRVSAAELKAADMVKLPLRVVTRHPSQKDALLADAVTLRSDLEKLAVAEAQATGEYLRPIMLIQAERVDACEPLRERMVTDFGIARDEIIISTGSKDELKDSRDIGTPKSKVRFILTVEKLREGWDCPFAYVLCSLKETRSSTAIEQIVGRILRLPKAAAKQHPDLNCAYAFSVSENIHEVLSELKDGDGQLVNCRRPVVDHGHTGEPPVVGVKSGGVEED